jgi:hypothetical protein
VDLTAPVQTVTIRAASDDTTAEDNITVLAADRPILSAPAKQYVAFGNKLVFPVTALSASGMALKVSAASLPPGSRFDPAGGIFEWIPDASQSGLWNVTFSATDAADRSASADVLVRVGSGVPVIENVRNAAGGSQDAVCSPGSLATIEGGWLSNDTLSDPSGQSLELGGTAVEANGVAVPVILVSPNQVIFECPHAPPGSTQNVAVAAAAGISGALPATMRDSALGIFTVGGSANGQAAATILDGSQFAMPRNHLFPGLPAQAGDSLRILMTGLSEDTQPH